MTDAREIIARAIEPFVHHVDDVTSVVINTLTAAGYRILGPGEQTVTEAMELARAVLAQSITAGHNVPGPTPEDIEKAFWALDAALKAAMEAR